MAHLVRHIIRTVDVATLVALVNALTGGSVPEYVVRDQVRRMRRDFDAGGTPAALQAA